MADLSVIQSLLNGEGIETLVFDQSSSFMYGPSQFWAPRVMVADDDYNRAQRIIREAGFAADQ